MSAEGRPTTADESAPDAAGMRVAIVAGRWNEAIAEALIAGARRTLDAAGAETELYRVDGSFELAIVARAALDAGAEAVVALGVIIRGGTPHFEYVSSATTDALSRVALDTGKPVGFGVLTLDDQQQGIDRAGLPGSKEDKGAEAAHAAVDTALVLRGMRSS